MFVGHIALALAAKARAPKLSLGAFVAASFLPDLLWPLFLATGLERVRIDPGNTRFTPLAFDSYPWSHGLVSCLGWGLLAALVARFALKADAQSQLLIALLVVSHWVLDFVTHGPDLPLWPGGAHDHGLGLWNHVAATLVVEGALLAAGLALYLRTTRARDAIGRWGFWSFIVLITVIWISQPFGPPPPSAQAIAIVGFVGWLLPMWAGWADGHRKDLRSARMERLNGVVG